MCLKSSHRSSCFLGTFPQTKSFSHREVNLNVNLNLNVILPFPHCCPALYSMLLCLACTFANLVKFSNAHFSSNPSLKVWTTKLDEILVNYWSRRNGGSLSLTVFLSSYRESNDGSLFLFYIYIIVHGNLKDRSFYRYASGGNFRSLLRGR